ncbi:hypothetical protein SAMN05421823_103552 [Catalinimonas alkaloidigena]|uniref:Holin-X, holin superfamily III n=1 Tax=Catalinimonas alkaloidigena TaxID=1075417 RepID=A0A1G9EQG5_9BACT|nr:hypothetical protein [Catalinimonas alkaloidigena]SDK78318.1 hypothetical protein SAMN05421823_103552 [Catalinimonas alkaloidigena]
MYKFFKLDSLLENLTGYIEARIELLRLTAIEKAEATSDKVSESGGTAIFFAIVAFLGLFLFVFLNIATATTLNHALNSTFWGYWIVTGFYLLIIIILLLAKKSIIGSFKNTIKAQLDPAIAKLRKSPPSQNGQAAHMEIKNGVIQETVIDHEPTV